MRRASEKKKKQRTKRISVKFIIWSSMRRWKRAPRQFQLKTIIKWPLGGGLIIFSYSGIDFRHEYMVMTDTLLHASRAPPAVVLLNNNCSSVTDASSHTRTRPPMTPSRHHTALRAIIFHPVDCVYNMIIYADWPLNVFGYVLRRRI